MAGKVKCGMWAVVDWTRCIIAQKSGWNTIPKNNDPPNRNRVNNAGRGIGRIVDKTADSGEDSCCVFVVSIVFVDGC